MYRLFITVCRITVSIHFPIFIVKEIVMRMMDMIGIFVSIH